MIWLLNKVRNCKSCTREETASCTSANYFFPPYFILWNQNAFQILSQMGKTDIYLWPYFILTLPHSILHFSSTVNSYGLSLCIVPCATVYVTNKIWNWIWNSHWAKLNYRWEYDVSFSHLGLTHVCWGYILQPWLRRTSAFVKWTPCTKRSNDTARGRMYGWWYFSFCGSFHVPLWKITTKSHFSVKTCNVSIFPLKLHTINTNHVHVSDLIYKNYYFIPILLAFMLLSC